MTPEIIRKLNEFLTSHVPFKEECEAVYLMVEIRKLLDREHPRDCFAKVRFYCDWTVHATINRNQTAINILEKINDDFNNGNPLFQESTKSFFSLAELRKELSDLFRSYDLQTQLCQNDTLWKHFEDLFIQVLADQALTTTINGISSVAFMPGNNGTKKVTVEFSDQRTPVTFGIDA